MSAHPMQPVEMVDGVARFKKNAIVEYLLTKSSMNDLAAMPFSKEDRNQFAQLIGYSVGGFGDLSYADPETVDQADNDVLDLLRGRIKPEPLPPEGEWVEIGEVGVDSGQILITDPCYIESEWKREERSKRRVAPAYRHDDGTILYCALHGGQPADDAIAFRTFDDVVTKYDKTANQMVSEGVLRELKRSDPSGEYSYEGCCDATLSEEQTGQLNYTLGHAGAGVVSSTGFGDGSYPVYAKFVDAGSWGRRVAELRVVFIDDTDFDDGDDEEEEDEPEGSPASAPEPALV